MENKVLIIDFGSQYTQLIARRVRELNIYSEIFPFNKIPSEINKFGAIILSGSPYSVRDKDSPRIDLDKITKNRPVLAVCYGAQLLANENGGLVLASDIREYGRANLDFINNDHFIFDNVNIGSQVWMSHGDTIKKLPNNSTLLASTSDVENAAFRVNGKEIYGLQFHPEVYHSKDGKKVLENFLLKISKLNQDWTPDSFIDQTVSYLKSELKSDKVILGLSGGVDSTVAAVLLNKAIGDNLHCIFVNNGLLRKNEFEAVLDQYKDMSLNVKGVDYSSKFYKELKGITDPELKRKSIGKVFIDAFDSESKKIKDVKWLAQGTIYPDVIESISATGGPSATIKSHHNVGGLPKKMNLKLVEPLNTLFKDEVRILGKELGLSDNIRNRHPFPGPGLAIRILGEVTKNRLEILRQADKIYIDLLKKEKLYDKIWQAFCVLLPVKTVGVMGDSRTYEYTCLLRAVVSEDGMTADYFNFPKDFLDKINDEILIIKDLSSFRSF